MGAEICKYITGQMQAAPQNLIRKRTGLKKDEARSPNLCRATLPLRWPVANDRDIFKEAGRAVYTCSYSPIGEDGRPNLR